MYLNQVSHCDSGTGLKLPRGFHQLCISQETTLSHVPRHAPFSSSVPVTWCSSPAFCQARFSVECWPEWLPERSTPWKTPLSPSGIPLRYLLLGAAPLQLPWKDPAGGSQALICCRPFSSPFISILMCLFLLPTSLPSLQPTIFYTSLSSFLVYLKHWTSLTCTK